MPSLEHEALVQLVRNEPAIAVHLLGAIPGVNPPDGPVRVLDSNLAQVAPTEYRADLVVAVGESARIIVEVQLGRSEACSILTWCSERWASARETRWRR